MYHNSPSDLSNKWAPKIKFSIIWDRHPLSDGTFIVTGTNSFNNYDPKTGKYSMRKYSALEKNKFIKWPNK